MASDAPVVIVSGGGTGGHLYPALAIADTLRAARPDVRVVFVGARRGLEARVLPERGEQSLLLPLYGIDRSRPLSAFRALGGLAVGLARTLRTFLGLRPTLVVVTGGYAGAAAGIAAVVMGIPLVLQEQNSFPGAVTRLLSRYAAQVHVAYPEAIARLQPGGERCIVSGNPVRDLSGGSRDEGRRIFGVPGDSVLTLVTGGSQGSRALNRALVAWVESVARGEGTRPAGLHVLWATGRLHFAGVDAALRGAGSPGWVHAVEYVEDMPAALTAADFALTRAGAMTIAELLIVGLPSILVPLPTAAEDHQSYNARALEAFGAARVIPEAELTSARLEAELTDLTEHPDARARMRRRALERARPDATRQIASDMESLLPPARRAA